ncbi:MAG: F0F1 ATP synthase subunit B [Pseudomonadota bacterium]
MAADAYAETAGHAAEVAFPPFDPTYYASQLFWFAICFAVLYFLLSRVVLPRIGSVIEERRDRVADDLDAAAQLKLQADETTAAYEKSLADARGKAQALAAEARADADAAIAQESAALNVQLEAKQADAEKRIAEARDKALTEVSTIAASAAAAVADQLAGLEVSEADAVKAVTASSKEG